MTLLIKILTAALVAAAISSPSLVVLGAGGNQCSLYVYQEQAQAMYDKSLEQYPELRNNTLGAFDPTGSGIACAELPAMPLMASPQVAIRALFDKNEEDQVVLQGTGYSVRLDIILAGVDFSSLTCPELVTPDALNELLIPEGDRVYSFIVASDFDLIQDTPATDTSLVWIPTNDPSAPVLVNEWLLAMGLARYDEETAPPEFQATLSSAAEIAEDSGMGVWGNCTNPKPIWDGEDHSPDNPYRPMVSVSGSGDSVVPFTITSEGTYKLTLNAGGGPTSLYFVDVYSTSGSHIHTLSISTNETGSFSAAAHLMPGDYYVQIKAIGDWTIELNPFGN